MSVPSLRRFFLAACLALAPLAPPATAQECSQGRISYIFVDNWSIFDTSLMGPDTPFLWAYRLANALHIRTREEFIRSELLFRTGDCLDPLLLEESERLLRNYPFIARSDVFAVPQSDGSQHVIVDTQDEWTTKIDLGIRLEDGVRFEGVEVTEENVLGRGILLRAFYEEEKEQRDMGLEAYSPRLWNTRWDGRLSAGNTRTGNFFEEAVAYPFLGEIGRFAARQSYVRRETLFSYAIPGDPEYTHALVPFLDQRWDFGAGLRLGDPGSLTTLGIGMSGESIRFREFPSDVELVVGGDFAETVPAGETALDEVFSQARDRSATRASFFVGQRNIRFVQQEGLDALKGTQDVPVGSEIFIGLGRGLEALQGDAEISPDDLHAQLTLFAGAIRGGWTLNSRFYTEGRQVYPGGGARGRWEDGFGEVDIYLYWRPELDGPHTLLFRASGAGGWRVRTPFQLTLGGRFGVRGYPEEAFPGGRRVVLTLEDRTYLPWPAPELFDFGLSAFVDLGFIRRGEVPFGVDSGWRGAAGVGVRFGLPPGTGNMARVDLAFPLDRRARPGDLILRVNLSETLGILPGILDEQLLRSLRSGIRPYLISVPW